jgi:hypothetical protein
LLPGASYQIRVRTQCSSNGSVLSGWSNIQTVAISPNAFSCQAPTGVNATPTSTTVGVVSWSSVSNALGYQFRYRPLGSTTWTLIVINGGATTTIVLTPLQPNTAYEYQVRAKCSNTPKLFSSYSPVSTFATPLMRIQESGSPAFAVYPNPTSGSLVCKAGALSGQLTVRDAIGRHVTSVRVLANESVIVNDLPTGVLVGEWLDEKGGASIERIVVIRP